MDQSVARQTHMEKWNSPITKFTQIYLPCDPHDPHGPHDPRTHRHDLGTLFDPCLTQIRSTHDPAVADPRDPGRPNWPTMTHNICITTAFWPHENLSTWHISYLSLITWTPNIFIFNINIWHKPLSFILCLVYHLLCLLSFLIQILVIIFKHHAWRVEHGTHMVVFTASFHILQ